jgi:hypothetical protein
MCSGNCHVTISLARGNDKVCGKSHFRYCFGSLLLLNALLSLSGCLGLSLPQPASELPTATLPSTAGRTAFRDDWHYFKANRCYFGLLKG